MNANCLIPELETARLRLRPFVLSDALEVQRQAGSPQVAATTANIPHPYPDGAAEKWIALHQEWFEKDVSVTWAIELKAEKKLVGCISFAITRPHQRAEMGYWIGEENWSRGYCTEAAKRAVTYLFESLQIGKVTARHMAENSSSGRVMLKLGMEKEGYFKKHLFRNGRMIDLIDYGLLKEDFIA